MMGRYSTLDQTCGHLLHAEAEVFERERITWLLRQFDTEPELKEIVKATVRSGPDMPLSPTNKLAQLLDATVEEIENRKKRIKLRLTKLAASCNVEGAKHV